jgi:soluble lytic murein transglycosylase
MRSSDLSDYPLRPMSSQPRPRPSSRTIVIRHGTGWQSLALLCLCVLLLAVVMLGHRALQQLEERNQAQALAMARVDRKLQQLDSGIGFDSRRRLLLLGMRDHIMTVNPRASLRDAFRYAELALDASERYPAVDPLLLLAIGTVESRFDPQAKSHADARGLYQIWPSTGRLLLRGLGWEYDDAALYDPEKNTQAAALYLDILFSAYNDPQMVLAEYNGGPLNAGYYRAGVSQLAAETRHYVPQVLELYGRLKERFEQGAAPPPDSVRRDAQREGKTLAGGAGPATARRRERTSPATSSGELPGARSESSQ